MGWSRPALACAILLLSACGSAAEPLDAALEYATKNQDGSNDALLDFVKILSISALVTEHKQDVLAAADWLKARLDDIGMKGARIIPTEGPQPVVYAEWLEAPDQPTVLIYGHYDVQPVDPLELWDIDPLNPILKDSNFYGRGADDDKGGLLSAVEGLAAWLKTAGKLPVNVKLLLEGQEEVGSPNLEAFLLKHKKLLAADYALSADGSQLSETEPQITIGLRGALGMEITHQTVDVDLHSGLWGGAVANPIHTITELVASFHAPNGSVAIEGFYDTVRAMTPEDEADIAAADAPDVKSVGAKGGFGEAGYGATARTWLRPTLEAVGIYGGFSGEGIKTIVPAKASVKLAARLVPDQDPVELLKVITRHVEKHSSPLAKVSIQRLGYSAKPFFMERDTVVNRAAAKVLEKVLGRKPFFTRVGGTIPAAALVQTILKIDFTMFAFGLPTDNIHSPNEKFPVAMFAAGIEGYVRLLHDLSLLAQQAAKDEL